MDVPLCFTSCCVGTQTMVYLTLGGKNIGGWGRREVKSDKWEEDRNVDGCTVVDAGPNFAFGSK